MGGFVFALALLIVVDASLRGGRSPLPPPLGEGLTCGRGGRGSGGVAAAGVAAVGVAAAGVVAAGVWRAWPRVALRCPGTWSHLLSYASCVSTG